MQTKLQFFFRHASQLYHKFQREKTSDNENDRLRKVTCYCCATYNHKLQQITTVCNIKLRAGAKENFCKDVTVQAQKMHG
jgi:hypothetical protein